jgi:alkane 1-monooxygenase
VVVAHELIHRRRTVRFVLGRVLLWTALYDHFFIEHLRGHHVRVGTHADPATARFDESFWRFLARSVPGEFVSAARLAPASFTLGVLAEIGIMAGLWTIGGRALAAFLLQALFSLLLVAVVNYLEHWGLCRSGPKIRAADSWDCDSLVTHALLFGLARHADHHARAARPYFELRLCEASPKLPHGYLRMGFLVLFRNPVARRLFADELKRKKLGPFLDTLSTA